jgi:hypothetical protein
LIIKGENSVKAFTGKQNERSLVESFKTKLNKKKESKLEIRKMYQRPIKTNMTRKIKGEN